MNICDSSHKHRQSYKKSSALGRSQSSSGTENNDVRALEILRGLFVQSAICINELIEPKW